MRTEIWCTKLFDAIQYGPSTMSTSYQLMATTLHAQYALAVIQSQ